MNEMNFPAKKIINDITRKGKKLWNGKINIFG